MEIITENIDERKLMFNEYLENYLGDISFVKMNFIKYGFNSRNLNFHIRYDERKLNSRNFNKHSIYYGILEKEDFQVYFFGSDFELKKNDEKVNPSIAVSLNVNNLNQSCIVFGKDNESKIYLLMKIKFDNLKIHQKAVLETYNDILEIDEKHYINFGCFDNKIQILRNIRNFIQKIDVDKSEYNFINIKSITIPYEYIKMVGLPEDYNECTSDHPAKGGLHVQHHLHQRPFRPGTGRLRPPVGKSAAVPGASRAGPVHRRKSQCHPPGAGCRVRALLLSGGGPARGDPGQGPDRPLRRHPRLYSPL